MASLNKKNDENIVEKLASFIWYAFISVQTKELEKFSRLFN